MKILVAADGSRYTKRMLAYLAAHDELLGPQHQYTVFTGVAPIPSHAAAMLDSDMLQSYYADEAESVFKPIRSFLAKQGLKANFVTKVGAVAEALCKQANAGKYDLIVMGNRGHGALGNLVMGSVATKVIANTDKPVLLVR